MTTLRGRTPEDDEPRGEWMANVAEIRVIIEQIRRREEDNMRDATRAIELVRQLSGHVGIVR